MATDETEARTERNAQRYLRYGLLAAVGVILVFYRFYQPVVFGALTQFDIFDWGRQTVEIVESGSFLTQHELWVFPLMNAIASLVSGLDVFTVYLFGGALLSSLNGFVLYAVGQLLLRDRLSSMLLVLLYATATRLLARSVMYLPETVSYSFGLLLVFFYLRLFMTRETKYLLFIGALTYLYYHLHQSGLNFILFSAVAVLLYLTFSLRLSRLRRALLVGGFLLSGALVFLLTPPLRQQVLFFLTSGNGSTDVAFRGTPIPVAQFWGDFDVLMTFFIPFGALAAAYLLFRRRTARWRRLTVLLLLLISGFYFSFLYLLPNLGLYSLLPWRFYTWFTLYAVLLAALGIHELVRAARSRTVLLAAVVLAVLLFSLPSGLVTDNMFTADRATIASMRELPVVDGATIITTNANYLQTRYAMVGRDVVVREDHDVFLSNSDLEAATVIEGRYDGPAFLLISLYQLRQRPWSIDYWRNSAIYDMDLRHFTGTPYFRTRYRDENVLLVQLNEGGV